MTHLFGISSAVVVVVNVAVLEVVLVTVGDHLGGGTVLSYERLNLCQCAIRFLALSARIVVQSVQQFTARLPADILRSRLFPVRHLVEVVSGFKILSDFQLDCKVTN